MFLLADGGGFEPPIPFGIHAFQACAIDHSATHPLVEGELITEIGAVDNGGVCFFPVHARESRDARGKARCSGSV